MLAVEFRFKLTSENLDKLYMCISSLVFFYKGKEKLWFKVPEDVFAYIKGNDRSEFQYERFSKLATFGRASFMIETGLPNKEPDLLIEDLSFIACNPYTHLPKNISGCKFLEDTKDFRFAAETFYRCADVEIMKQLYTGTVSYQLAKENAQNISELSKNIITEKNNNMANFFDDTPEKNSLVTASAIGIWSDQVAFKLYKKHPDWFNDFYELKKPLIIYEDGFLASVDLFQQKNSKEYNNKYCRHCAYTISNFAHYDSRGIGILEKYLTTEFEPLADKQIRRAQRNIKAILDNQLSKYNNQFNKPDFSSIKKKKILILDQALGDQSVQLSNASPDTFKRMVEEACKEDAMVFVKVHPEQLVGRRQGYYVPEDKTPLPGQFQIKETENLKFLSEFYNPIALIQSVDEVWCVSSQMGFEALMCGKKVRTFGTSFYAGYGLTEDDLTDHKILQRRSKFKRTLEELFYIAYIKYSHYMIPGTYVHCEIEDAIQYLINNISDFKSSTKKDL